MNDIIIANPSEFESKIEALKKDGPSQLHVVADFDNTLTKAFVQGKRVPSMISILRDHGFLSPEYQEKAKALYAQYHPLEIDPRLSLQQKKKAMQEWWRKHADLLVESKLHRRDVEKLVESPYIELRAYADRVLKLLHANKIPLVILSSNQLGKNPIESFLKYRNAFYGNMLVISNVHLWNKEGYLTGIQEPIIHSFNKDESVLYEKQELQSIKKRKNVILLGDSLGDIGMAAGLEHKTLISFGFLNEHPEHLETYKKVYDVVLLNDASMEFVHDTLKKILTKT